MTKKFLFATAITLVTLGIMYNSVNAEAQIIIDPITKTITITGINLSTGTQTTGTQTTGTTQTGITQTGTTIKTGTVTTTTVQTTGTEFERALSWMYANGLTKYNKPTDYRMYDELTREEAAKMIAQAYIVLGYGQEQKNSACAFSDAGEFNPELTGFIKQVCGRGVIKGANGKYMPTKKLTRPEAMAILVRMFEGQTSFEAKDPRWSEYYIKGKALGLTTLNTSTFEKEISRYEIALYIYRLQTIANDVNLKLQSQLKLQNLTGVVQTTGTITNTVPEESSELAQKFAAIANSISVEKDPELQEAIRWMHDNGLTSFLTIGEYKPFEVLTREQSAKIFDVFAKIFDFSQDKLTSTLPTECQFKDLAKADQTLTTHIQNVCKMEILKGGNQLFDPKNTLTKGQFITALIRLVEGKKLDESKNPRWTAYYQNALDMGIVGPADAITFDSPITRYEVALFLYRFRVKFQLINNLNNNSLENMILNTIPGSIKTGDTILSGEIPEAKEADIFIDTNLIQNANFELGYIEIFSTKYKVIKTSTETYFSKNFVRYGDIYDISTDKKIGTINFIVSNRAVLEGTARINTNTYTISQVANTTAYYHIKKN
ncbi:hypothetical protein P148_SR1C00001G0774 [candidate division SR1 bacterium RAAC1_SR1_1]|nr:hypothetical protein P148_SR1C00001G0774 [candidate division SR1 bacterium RAAC1_SR1_1]